MKCTSNGLMKTPIRSFGSGSSSRTMSSRQAARPCLIEITSSKPSIFFTYTTVPSAADRIPVARRLCARGCGRTRRNARRSSRAASAAAATRAASACLELAPGVVGGTRTIATPDENGKSTISNRAFSRAEHLHPAFDTGMAHELAHVDIGVVQKRCTSSLRAWRSAEQKVVLHVSNAWLPSMKVRSSGGRREFGSASKNSRAGQQ